MKKLIVFMFSIVLLGSCKKDKDSTVNIGDIHQGGIVFYLDGNGGGLIASNFDNSELVNWGCNEISDTLAIGISVGTGLINTNDILIQCAQPVSAAAYCNSLNVTFYDTTSNDSIIYDDWFLPSKDELNLMYQNIGPISSIGNIGGFSSSIYWSSSNYYYNTAWRQSFLEGHQDTYLKSYECNVRAIRAF